MDTRVKVLSADNSDKRRAEAREAAREARDFTPSGYYTARAIVACLDLIDGLMEDNAELRKRVEDLETTNTNRHLNGHD